MTTTVKRYYYASYEENSRSLKVFGFENMIDCVNWIDEINKSRKFIDGKIAAEKIDRQKAMKYVQCVNKLLTFTKLTDHLINPYGYKMYTVLSS